MRRTAHSSEARRRRSAVSPPGAASARPLPQRTCVACRSVRAKRDLVRVDIVADDKTAYVVVPDRQLSLAIGKEGQNARLAAKLTGWRIDIRSESEVRAELEPEPEPEPEVTAEVAPVAPTEEAELDHDLVAEVEAESALADEEDLDEEDRALLGGKKKKERR